MREVIRFTWNGNPLGDLIIAVPEKRLVALEFGSDRTSAQDALRRRFPGADLVEAAGKLKDVVSKVNRAIENPDFDAAISLDLRGTPYEVEVWSMLRALPVGEATTYGALAAQLGTRIPAR
jgi:AraC family transcriptional regulator, regulatory protein of adaptative response / methylated-DNA-[protein]-cysteine methyltransferase